jgi:hypothetical protein
MSARLASALPVLASVAFFPAGAQETERSCRSGDVSAACSAAPREDAWERISEELHEFTTQGIRQAPSGSGRSLAAVSAEMSNGASGGNTPTPGGTTTTPRIVKPACDPARATAEDSQALCPRYQDVLHLLRGAGMSLAEACPLAAADAFGVDWVVSSRWCIEQRTGVRTYDAFTQVLRVHGASPREACEAAERYWNGLALPSAQEICARRSQQRMP